MTDLVPKIKREGPTMALAAVGVLAVVAVGLGIFVASIRVLLPVVYSMAPGIDPTAVAAAVGFGPAAVYGVTVAALIRRYVVRGD